MIGDSLFIHGAAEGFHVTPRIGLGHHRPSGLARLFRTFEIKLGNASQRSSHARKRQGMGRGGVSLAVMDEAMARSSLLLISCGLPAKSMMPVMKKI
jgi:hypothetical protein